MVGNKCVPRKTKGVPTHLVFGTSQECWAKNPRQKQDGVSHLPQYTIYNVQCTFTDKQTGTHTDIVTYIYDQTFGDTKLYLENSRLGTACPLEFLAHV